jgi:hypothetical protein
VGEVKLEYREAEQLFEAAHRAVYATGKTPTAALAALARSLTETQGPPPNRKETDRV